MTISSARTSRVARQFSARSQAFVTLTVNITLLAMTASFALSFNAQVAIAALIGLAGWMRFLLPVGVDSFILVSALSLAVLRERDGIPGLLPSSASAVTADGPRPAVVTAMGLDRSQCRPQHLARP